MKPHIHQFRNRFLAYYKFHYFLHLSPTYYAEVIYMMNTQIISDSLQSLGISKCYKGYRQLFLSVELALDDESRLISITENIYNPVSVMCNCNCSNIERNIRTVAHRTWKVNSNKLSEMAGYTLCSSPSVSELISILVAYIERNNRMNT